MATRDTIAKTVGVMAGGASRAGTLANGDGGGGAGGPRRLLSSAIKVAGAAGALAKNAIGGEAYKGGFQAAQPPRSPLKNAPSSASSNGVPPSSKLQSTETQNQRSGTAGEAQKGNAQNEGPGGNPTSSPKTRFGKDAENGSSTSPKASSNTSSGGANGASGTSGATDKKGKS